MKILKTLLVTALVCAASWTLTHAAPDLNPDEILAFTAQQTGVSSAELHAQYQGGEATITEREDGVVEVAFRAADGGIHIILIRDSFRIADGNPVILILEDNL